MNVAQGCNEMQNGIAEHNSHSCVVVACNPKPSRLADIGAPCRQWVNRAHQSHVITMSHVTDGIFGGVCVDLTRSLVCVR